MIQEGTNVKWEWGDRYAIGEVKEMFAHEISTTIHGHEVTIQGKVDDKALLIGHSDGTEILRLQSQVTIYDIGRH
ncbi:MAG: HVA1 family protein [Flavobacteriales bacterium]|nr:HVA1 family protein [Flavobacteriales bacterium]